MLRYFFKSLHIIGWFLLTCLAAVFFILYTQTGLYATLYLVKKFGPGVLSYKTAQGYLMGDFSVDGVHYRQEGINVRAARVSLQWEPSALLHQQVSIKQLTLNRLNVMDIAMQEVKISGNAILTESLPISVNIDWKIAQPLYSKSLPFCLYEEGSKKTAYTPVLRPFLYSSELSSSKKSPLPHPLKKGGASDQRSLLTKEKVYRQYMTKIEGEYQPTENSPMNQISGKIQINGNEKDYKIHAVIVRPFDLDFEGEVQNLWEENPQFSLLASWKKILLDNQSAMETSGEAYLSGGLNHYQGEIDASLNLDQGTIYPFNAHIKATPTNVNAKLTVGDKTHLLADLSVEGKHTPLFNLNWTMTIPNIAVFTENNPMAKKAAISPGTSQNEFAGAFDAKGTIKGLSTDLTFNSTIQASELKYQPLYIKKIMSHINISHIFTDKLSADVDLQINSGDLIYTTDTEKNIIPFEKFNTKINWKNNILKTNVEWIFDAAKKFEGTVIIQPITWKNFDIKELAKHKLSGKLLFAMNNLDFVNAETSPLKQIKGTFQANINLSGNLAEPVWAGAANLQAQGTLPDLGITLNQINVELQNTSKNMKLNGKIISGSHTLSIIGESSTPTLETFKAKITGNDFMIMNTPEYKISATPDLNIQWSQKPGEVGKIVIDGTIDVPFAKIQPLEFTESVELPSDVVFISDKKEKKEATPFFELDSRITVRLGKDVQIQTHGLKGRLEGSVDVIDKNNASTTGEGEIRIVQGTYNAYGQLLDLEKGEADFTGGAIDNPQLLIRAIRTFNSSTNFSPISNNAIPAQMSGTLPETSLTEFNKITVGIEITGTAENPIVKLFSNPATLSQADILSFLVLGRPMSQASSADGALLMRALSALNVGGGQETQIVQQLQKTFGLDVLNVETSSQYDSSQNSMTNNTSLVIGKKLSARLFIDYSIGLMQDTNILKIKYLLTPNWIFQTSTDGTNEGADIIYSITKN
jgi:translocation and assembly module TamB